MSEALDRLNSVSAEEASALFLPCCDCRAWARRMAEGRPYRSLATSYLFSAAFESGGHPA